MSLGSQSYADSVLTLWINAQSNTLLPIKDPNDALVDEYAQLAWLIRCDIDGTCFWLTIPDVRSDRGIRIINHNQAIRGVEQLLTIPARVALPISIPTGSLDRHAGIYHNPRERPLPPDPAGPKNTAK